MTRLKCKVDFWCTVCVEYTIGSEIILAHSMVPIGDEAQVEACFGLSNIVLILMQDWCTVCDEP